MKKIILTLSVASAIIFISGCKSLSDMRMNGAANSFVSNKSLNEVSECILSGWHEKRFLTGPMHVYIQPYKNGRTVYVDEYTWVADITPEADGHTGIKYYTQSNGRNQEMQDVIRACI
ncbi:hypothetical protein [Klebsiella michiganensis]|uniref:hypothetical protein n=1 Tax=Klebsiella michiganensis TaxID=1134687 RepID=UPI0027D38F33|nr:hypothetical protein [Klebsiella michiganensis]MDQ4328332.1 hypothetical protein [Klebsiella michiganensis]